MVKVLGLGLLGYLYVLAIFRIGGTDNDIRVGWSCVECVGNMFGSVERYWLSGCVGVSAREVGWVCGRV